MATSKVAYLVKPKIVNGVEGEAIVELRDIEIPTPGPGEILVNEFNLKGATYEH